MGQRQAILGAIIILFLAVLFAQAGAQPAVAPQVVINEVVTDPQTDWSTTGFDGTDGGGTISQGVDEWLELLINAAGLDLTGWTIELIDTSPVTGSLTSTGAFQVSRYFGSGSFTGTQAGDRLILGNVVGSGAMNNDIFIVLRDATGAVVDDVEVGDAGQPGDGAPAPGEDGNATSPSDEAIARVPDGADTDDDAADFAQQSATLGTSNGQPPTPTPSPTSAPASSVLINEVVTDPQTDWSTTGFDGTDGGGTISQGVDEWIELLIGTAGLNLTNWTIELRDTSPVTGDLTDAGAFQVSRYIGAGSFTSTQPGDRLILGNVAGSGAMNDDVFIILSDVTGLIIDDVEIGFDPEGDGDDGAPEAGQNGNATGPGDEAIARVPDGSDTDNDTSDFAKQPASLGAANPVPTATPTPTSSPSPTTTPTPTASSTPTSTPTAMSTSTSTATSTPTTTPTPTPTPATAAAGSVLINEVVTDPQQDWNDSQGGNGAPFDGTPGAGANTSSDEWLELLNVAGHSIDLTGWTLVMRDTTPATQILGQGSAVLRFSAGGSLTDFRPGERLVIGNPTGVLNNDIYIELRDASGQLIDDVEIGDDLEGDGSDGAPGAGLNGNALTIYDEAIARVPDGRDTDDDPADFEKHPASIGKHNGNYVNNLAQLPGLNTVLGTASCAATIEIQNVGAEATKAIILFWENAGSCPPQCAGPFHVSCTGLLKPGSTWHLGPEQLPSNARSGIVFSTFGLEHPAFEHGEEVFADALCETLFAEVQDDCDNYRRFRRAFDERAVWDAGRSRPDFNFAAFPGQPIAVEVRRLCQSDGEPATTSAYIGTRKREFGLRDPLFGGYAYHLPLVYAGWHGWDSALYIQNAGLECSSVELWFRSQGECRRSQVCEVPAIAPGESQLFDAGDCVGPDWVGNVWLRSSQPAAIIVDTAGPDVLTTYQAMPAQINDAHQGNVGPHEQSADPLFTPGSQINFGPLIFREHQGWGTRIQVQNLSSVLSAKIKVYFLDESGGVIHSMVDWVCPRSSQAYTLAAISGLPGNWVGQVRVESQNWVAPGSGAVPAPNIVSVAQLTRWSGPAQAAPVEAMSYNLLSEEQVFEWQTGGGRSGLESGAGLIAFPSLSSAPAGAAGNYTQLAIQNAVVKPGVTDFVLFLYDQNGLLDFVCESLSAQQVEYINLADWSYVNPRFVGSAVISAVAWEHPVRTAPSGGAVRNLLGLAAVKTERLRVSTASVPVPAGDQASASVGIPLDGPVDPDPIFGFAGQPPACPR